MSVARFGHSATRRLDGRVLVAGGTAGFEGLRSTEVYVQSTGRWVTTSDMTTARESDDICCKQAVLLASGKVLVAGGWNAGVLRTAEVYDPATGAWTPTGSMRVGREGGFHLGPAARRPRPGPRRPRRPRPLEVRGRVQREHGKLASGQRHDCGPLRAGSRSHPGRQGARGRWPPWARRAADRAEVSLTRELRPSPAF